MRISVKFFAGRTFILDVNSIDNIDTIKAKVQEKEGIHPEKQILIFDGKQLEGDCILYHYNIQKRSALNLVLRRLGMQFFVAAVTGIALDKMYKDMIMTCSSMKF